MVFSDLLQLYRAGIHNYGGGNEYRAHFRFAETSDDAHFFREARYSLYLSNKKNLRSIRLLTAKIQPLIGGDLAILLISKKSLTISLPNW